MYGKQRVLKLACCSSLLHADCQWMDKGEMIDIAVWCTAVKIAYNFIVSMNSLTKGVYSLYQAVGQWPSLPLAHV